MVLVIAIGFEYDGNMKLPGSRLDVFRVYRYSLSINAKFHMLTDFDVEIISNSKSDNQHIFLMNQFILSNKNIQKKIHTADDLLNFISLIKNPERIILYFTGHGVKNSIILPNGKYIHINDIHKKLTEKSPISIVWVIDACGLNGACLNLPYNLDNNRYHLQEHVLFHSIETYCISACRMINEDYDPNRSYIIKRIPNDPNMITGSTVDGSPFTKSLIGILSTIVRQNRKNIMNRNDTKYMFVAWAELQKQIDDKMNKYINDIIDLFSNDDHQQIAKSLQERENKPEIFVSSPELNYIPGWMYGDNVTLYDKYTFLVY